MGNLKVSNFPVNKENPFLKQAIEVVNKNVVKKYKNATNTGERAVLQAVDPETGEMRGITSFVRQIEVDEDKFIKVYLSEFQKFFSLSPCAIKVFGYFIQNLWIDKDMVLFQLDKAMEYTGYKSHRMVYKGIAELLNSEIMARGWTDNIYFVNPMCIFNGNRINFVKSFVKKNQEQTAQIDEQNDTPLIDKI